VRRIAEGRNEKLVVTPELIQSKEFLGGMKIRTDSEIAERTKRPGVVVGLAWTPSGGDILFVEATVMKGKGDFTITGQIQDVMRESMQAARSWVRSNAEALGIDQEFFEKKDIHIHVPEGAIPKDGPSAGIALATSLFSAVTRLPVLKDVAMTGEITLRGKVLPVGGIKDKVLAAFRAGIRTIVLPAENEKDLEEIPKEVREAIEVHLVENMDEVIKVALDHAAAPAAKPPEVEAKLPAPPPGLTH